jgi:hypothetical protein
MCRLFGMSGGRTPLRATFWLGTFGPDGAPRVDKRAAAAYRDHKFARQAREVVWRL